MWRDQVRGLLVQQATAEAAAAAAQASFARERDAWRAAHTELQADYDAAQALLAAREAAFRDLVADHAQQRADDEARHAAALAAGLDAAAARASAAAAAHARQRDTVLELLTTCVCAPGRAGRRGVRSWRWQFGGPGSRLACTRNGGKGARPAPRWRCSASGWLR